MRLNSPVLTFFYCRSFDNTSITGVYAEPPLSALNRFLQLPSLYLSKIDSDHSKNTGYSSKALNMKIDIYQVDAFTDQLFSGNPAAVCPLDSWLPKTLMQSIAAENNLSETVFFVEDGDAFHIRWFTPFMEVKLCGHATLASAYVLFEILKVPTPSITFHSLSGRLAVEKEPDGALTMDFPIAEMVPCSTPQALWESLGAHPIECYRGDDYMAVLDSEETLLALQPDLQQMATLPVRGIIVTARGNACDFVSRFFAPQSGIDEDPVTGSAHCATAPYWANKLKKTKLSAIQCSKRMGHLTCEVIENRVKITGKAILYLMGTIHIDESQHCTSP
jgi:PhzF family phenazine biosynthesis protein